MKSLCLFRWRGAVAALGLAALAACGGGSSDPAAPAEGGSGTPPVALSLTAVGNSARTASLSWTPAAGATGYTLERKSANSAWAVIATLGPHEHSYVDDGLAQVTAYTYRVAAQGTGATAAEQAATTTAHAPVVTEAALTLDGTPDTGDVGAAGGSVVSADGSVRVTLAGGALAAPTALTLRRTSNPLSSGIDAGVRVSVRALPAQPLTLKLRYDATMDAQADGLGAALQRADGSWLALPVTAVDKAARMLTVSVSPALVARQTASARALSAATAAAAAEMDFVVVRYLNLYLSPRQASVQTGKTQLLVPYAHTEGLPCWADPDVGCLPAPVLEKREIPFENRKAGYTRKWYVFAEEGGTPALGTVTPRDGTGAVYQAPALAPTPNPVAVSFVSRHDKSGRTVTLSSSILVREPVWTMILNGTLEQANDIGFSYSAQAVWTREAGDAEVYRANGTQSVQVINIVCSATPTPATVPLPPGALTIDRSVQPARYRLDVGSIWDTMIAGTCPDGGFANVPARVPGQLIVEGTLSADGTRIEGTVSQNHVTWNWSLTNQL